MQKNHEYGTEVERTMEGPVETKAFKNDGVQEARIGKFQYRSNFATLVGFGNYATQCR
jgi:hypothetical protein